MYSPQISAIDLISWHSQSGNESSQNLLQQVNTAQNELQLSSGFIRDEKSQFHEMPVNGSV